MKICIAVIFIIATCGLADATEQNYIWWEGEGYSKTNAPDPLMKVPGNSKPEQQKLLSGGAWFTPKGKGTVFAEYDIETSEAKTWNLWVRKFWRHGPFKWRFDDQDWVECSRNRALHDSTFLEVNWGATWVYLGKVELSKGTHQMRIEMLEENTPGCIDCFLLIEGSFIPRGNLKPGEKTGSQTKGWFAWEPDSDPVDGSSPIDLRHLNEQQAGQSGHVHRKGQGFVLGDGTPVRFIEKGTVDPYLSKEMVDYRAKRLAKYGVNMARIGFCRQYPMYAKGDMKGFNEYLDRIHYLVYAFREQGIYTWLRFYWKTGETDFFIDPEFRKHYLEYVDHIMNTKNPYTGLPMSQDPAVALCAIQNENNFLFHTFNPKRIETGAMARVEKSFAAWTVKKYGSLANALEGWGPDKYPSKNIGGTVDNIEAGRLGLYSIGHLTSANWAVAQRNPKRASDQLQFLVEAQKKAYTDIINAFRNKFGIKCMISCCNWKTADPKVLGPFEHYSYTPGDMVTRNIYFGPSYKPRPKKFYAVEAGDTFTMYSSLKSPKIPDSFTVAHTNDMPYTVSESNWDRPNKHRSEWPFLVATYGAMIGADSWSFNGNGGPLWNTTMKVWDVNSPSVMGQLPAVALAFRKYITEAETVVTDTLSLSDLYNFKGTNVTMGKGADALWISKIGDKETETAKQSGSVDPLAFFVGKVERKIGNAAGKLEQKDLSHYIDREKGIVSSITGEIRWDFVNGVVTVNNPYVQGACGFLGTQNKIDLGDIEINCKNDFAVIMVVSLDDNPLKESNKILIQAATEDRTSGFTLKELDDGRVQITDVGHYPLIMKEVDASVVLKNRTSIKADILNQAGYLCGQHAATDQSGNTISIELPKDTMYTFCHSE